MQSSDDEAVPSPIPGGWASSSPPTSRHIDPLKANIAEALLDRRDEYVIQKKIRIKVGTWNVASTNGTERDIQNWFVKEKEIADHLASLKLEKEGEDTTKVSEAKKTLEHEKEGYHNSTQHEDHAEHEGRTKSDDEVQEIGLYILGLQEIVDISSPALLLNPYIDPAPARKWKHAVEEALPLGYQPVAQQQLIGLYLLIYASPLVKPFITDVSTISVATGGMGWTGNKGAVAARLVLGGFTKMLFVNSHLTAGNDKNHLDRRNWDVNQILNRARFPAVDSPLDPTKGQPETIGDEDFAFWFGDLNYRLEGIPGDDVRRLLMLHTSGEYGHHDRVPARMDDLVYGGLSSEAEIGSNASEPPQSSITLAGGEKASSPWEDSPLTPDPTSLQSTLSSLISHDQLRSQVEQRKVFHDGWQEGDITFLPTYKYDIGTVDMFDSSEKMRPPGFCDRILFRTKQRREALRQAQADAEVKTPKLGQQPSGVLFDYNPEEDEEETPANNLNQFTYSFNDKMVLHSYTSHQDITSSDHKPLEAVFTIIYDFEDQVKKEATHWLIARMFDDAENENRPRITIVSNPYPFTHNRTIDFGRIVYGETYVDELNVANTGMKQATLTITSSNDKLPSWLAIGCQQGLQVLEVGDVRSIAIMLCVTDKELTWCLNSKEDKLEHVLIVRVEGGADYFVSIRAQWTPFEWAG